MRRSPLTLLLAVLAVAPSPAAEEPPEKALLPRVLERPGDRPGALDPRQDPAARAPSVSVPFGSYVSVQVNVDAAQMNILGDAANEPSIAVNALDPNNIVVGWRQFNTVASDFREAGWSYSFDGGSTWTFPGTLEPGIFRSDPVLGADSSGNIFYQSLTANADLSELYVDVFQSGDGGVTWPSKTPSFGGDKNWMVIDRSGAPSDGHVYGIWQRFFSCCDPDVLTRSTDGGASFEIPVAVDLSPTFGTMAVGPGGVLYMAGIDGTSGQDTTTFVVSRSLDAANPTVTPTSTGTVVPMGGHLAFSESPNPGGLLGQADVAADLSAGPTSGNVYLAASVLVLPALTSTDLNVARSEDGGVTWSAPVRVNDDQVAGSWQWLGAIDVAPDGRIDAIWYDTRNFSPLETTSQLFYSYSKDGGRTWARNVAASPGFPTTIGYPGAQTKIGDYIGLRSDATGTSVAYTATFNGEQDVWFVRLFPDCNENTVPDDVDISTGTSLDVDGNGIPDDCNPPVFVGAGAVPDGATIPGTPLTVSFNPPDGLMLEWGAGCSVNDLDYAVYEGVLGDFGSHQPLFCSTGGVTVALVSAPVGSAYYLVVPVSWADGLEGAYGLDSSGAQRPPGLVSCLPQQVLACP